MAKPTIEERVTKLEVQMADLLANGVERKKDWRRTVGMFTGDEIMKQVDEEARRYREADRQRFYKEYDRKHGKRRTGRR